MARREERRGEERLSRASLFDRNAGKCRFLGAAYDDSRRLVRPRTPNDEQLRRLGGPPFPVLGRPRILFDRCRRVRQRQRLRNPAILSTVFQFDNRIGCEHSIIRRFYEISGSGISRISHKQPARRPDRSASINLDTINEFTIDSTRCERNDALGMHLFLSCSAAA